MLVVMPMRSARCWAGSDCATIAQTARGGSAKLGVYPVRDYWVCELRFILFHITNAGAVISMRGNDIMGNGKSRVAPRGFVEITVEIARGNDIMRGRQSPLLRH